MAEAKSDKTFPSNSGIAKSGKRSRLFSKSPESSNGQNSEDILALRSFNAVAKITELLKQSHTEGFVTVLEKLLALVEDDNSTRRDAKYGFIENLLSNVLEGDMEGFVSAEQLFESKIGVIPERDLQVQLFDEEDIVRLKKLGSGESSIVTLGKVKTLDQKVALKRAKFSEWDQVIEDEINLLLNLKHDNILKLFGKHRTQPVMVVEFMDLGDLYSAVQTVSLSTGDLFTLLGGVASGMEYMHEKKYIHRDLAAKNVYMNRKKQCKIGSFEFAVYVGDCKDGVYLQQPLHEPHGYHLSSRANLRKEFTMANDVWAMGILCWEAFYLMEYSKVLGQFQQKKGLLLNSHRSGCLKLPKSRLCPETFYSYFTSKILVDNPKSRPSFTAIKAKLKEFAPSWTN